MTSTADSNELKSARGRPRAAARRHTAENLLAAIERGLREKTYDELRVRDIAAMAGTNEAMIRYYFGGKDGLLCALVDNHMRNVARRMAEIPQCIAAGKSPTRCLVEAFVIVRCSGAAIVRAVTTERLRGASPVKTFFDEKYMRQTHHSIDRMLREMVDSGIYDARLNRRYAAMTVLSVVVWPILYALTEPDAITLDELMSEAWLDHITEVLERSFGRAPI